MKTASKVFLIISLVCGVIGFFLLIFFMTLLNNEAIINAAIEDLVNQGYNSQDAIFGVTEAVKILKAWSIFGLILLIVGVVLAIITLVRINKFKSRGEVIAFGVLTLIFCNLIAGILILCIPNSELQNTQMIDETKSEDLDEKLKKIDELQERGAITEEEKNKLKIDVINDSLKNDK